LAIAIIVVETSDFVDVGKKLGFNGRSEVRGQIAEVRLQTSKHHSNSAADPGI
jgi:hypothetical protein